ncbi:OsmC family protein [candidate division KSB1 bacterium]
MEIDVRWNKGMNFEADTPSGHTVQLDSAPKGEPTKGPSPMEQVALSVAGCSGMDIVAILEKRRKKLEKFEIKVKSERADDHPKVFTKVEILYRFKADGLKLEEAEKAVKLSLDKYCSVSKMISSTAELNWKCELID